MTLPTATPAAVHNFHVPSRRLTFWLLMATTKRINVFYNIKFLTRPVPEFDCNACITFIYIYIDLRLYIYHSLIMRIQMHKLFHIQWTCTHTHTHSHSGILFMHLCQRNSFTFVVQISKERKRFESSRFSRL